jgi:hypothetical protein
MGKNNAAINGELTTSNALSVAQARPPKKSGGNT